MKTAECAMLLASYSLSPELSVIVWTSVGGNFFWQLWQNRDLTLKSHTSNKKAPQYGQTDNQTMWFVNSSHMFFQILSANIQLPGTNHFTITATVQPALHPPLQDPIAPVRTRLWKCRTSLLPTFLVSLSGLICRSTWNKGQDKKCYKKLLMTQAQFIPLAAPNSRINYSYKKSLRSKQTCGVTRNHTSPVVWQPYIHDRKFYKQ